MRFTVNRTELCEAVTNLSKAVATKATFPVLEGILLIAKNNKLMCKAYNLEMGMTKDLDINCVEEGEIVLSAKLLGDILRRLSETDVVIEVNDRKICKIKCGSAMFDIMGMDSADFPEMPTIDECERIVINNGVLKQLVGGTAFAAASPEMLKPILTGLLFECEENGVCVVGVDGIKLALKREKINIGKKMSFVISAKTIAEAIKINSDDEEDTELFVGRRHIAIVIGGYSIISRRIEGEFIDYRKIMPSSFATTIKVNTRDVINIIERISLIINDQLKTPIRCKIEEEKIVFSCETAVGKAVENYRADIEGQQFEIGLNSKYLLETLRATEAEEVILNFNGPYASVIILPTANDGFMYMVMPIKLKAE